MYRNQRVVPVSALGLRYAVKLERWKVRTRARASWKYFYVGIESLVFDSSVLYVCMPSERGVAPSIRRVASSLVCRRW